MVDWHNRWNPPYHAAWKSIRDGELGDVRYIYYRLSDTVYVPTHMLPWAGESSVLLFLGSHALDTTCWFMGKRPLRVTCRRQEGILRGRGIDTADTYVTVVDFEGGAVAVIENSGVLPESSPALMQLLITGPRWRVDEIAQQSKWTRLIKQTHLPNINCDATGC